MGKLDVDRILVSRACDSWVGFRVQVLGASKEQEHGSGFGFLGLGFRVEEMAFPPWLFRREPSCLACTREFPTQGEGCLPQLRVLRANA